MIEIHRKVYNFKIHVTFLDYWDLYKHSQISKCFIMQFFILKKKRKTLSLSLWIWINGTFIFYIILILINFIWHGYLKNELLDISKKKFHWITIIFPFDVAVFLSVSFIDINKCVTTLIYFQLLFLCSIVLWT